MGWASVAFGEGVLALGGSGSGSFESPLVIPEVQPLVGGQGVAEAEEARRDSSAAVIAREESRTRFAGLGAAEAAKVAAETFPALVDTQAGGLPRLPARQAVTGYLTNYAAEVALAGGKRGVLESLTPIAVKTSQGRAPVDLGLSDAEGAIESKRPVVKVRIPMHLREGVRFSALGVSLTPVDAQGVALDGSEGVVDGATVLYANTETDADTVVKPTAFGFAVDAVLRSVASPRRLYYRVGMPRGARLVQERHGGSVRVVLGGSTIAVILAPGARDATGLIVPVSMSVSGARLTLAVDDESGEYRWPIEVDPEVNDRQLAEATGGKRSNWEFATSNTSRFASKASYESAEKEYLETYGTAAYAEKEFAYWAYQTQGVSKIYEFKAETEAKNKEDHIESFLELEAHGTGAQESKELLSSEAEKTSEYSRKAAAPICPKNSKGEQECLPTAGGAGNAVRFQQSSVASGSKFSFSDFLYQGIVSLSEPSGTHATTNYNTAAESFTFEIEREGKKESQTRTNAMHGTGSWLSNFDGALELIAKDTGIGVSATRLEYEASPGKWEQLSEHNYLEEDKCKGVQCYDPEHTEIWTLNDKLPNGEDIVRYRAEEAMPETKSGETEGETTIKVDKSAPRRITLSGLPFGNELSEKTYELTLEATDGEGATIASSGIPGIAGSTKGLALFVDGHEATEVGTQRGCSAPKGECTASSKWTINGSELGAGHHAIVLVAKDRAGNEARHEEEVSIRHSTPVAMGPGSVDLQSGDFSVSSTDVSLGSGLTVARNYSSRDLTQGVEGPLGPQWSMSLGTSESLVELIDGGMLLTDSAGGQMIFAKTSTATYESPPGDANLKLVVEENEKTKEKLAFYLENAAVHTKDKFTLQNSATKTWMPTRQEGVVATDTVSYTYQTEEVEGKKIIEPLEALAAVPPGVSCAPKLEPGCRELQFSYSKATTATGENESEWGEFKGRLHQVTAVLYNPVTKEMAKVVVAQYLWDKQGRLRAEWDPRTSPALKTIDGYDAENHLTALTAPGRETWALTYGTIPGDASSGRLLKATQAPASASLWNGKSTSNTEAPKLTGSAIVGAAVSVSNGAWSNSPVSYGYQWEDCNESGGACTPIPGATNSGYTPTVTDDKHTLVAEVTATNGGGSVIASSAPSAVVTGATPTYSSEFGSKGSGTGQLNGPEDITTDSAGNVWVIDTGNHRIDEWSSTGTFMKAIGYGVSNGEEKLEVCTTSCQKGIKGDGHGQFEAPVGIAIDSEGNIWVCDDAANDPRAEEFTSAGEFVKEFKTSSQATPRSIAVDASGDVWILQHEVGANNIFEFTSAGQEIQRFEAEGGHGENPVDFVLAPSNELDTLYEGGTNPPKVVERTRTGQFIKEFGSQGSTNGKLSGPTRISLGPENTLWITESGNHRVQVFTPSGEYLAKFGKEGSGAGEFTQLQGVSIHGSSVYVNGYESNRVEKWTLPPTESKPGTPGPGLTMEYNIPLEGTAAPYQMGANETTHTPEPEKWGQTDDPAEATAIFPVDEPQTWPASSYKRASVYYLDEQGHNVNVAAPSTATYGSISTAEFNESNDVTRTLTADNRATALAAGTNSAEVSKLLDTENTYNEPECHTEQPGVVAEPGTRLCETLGPQHEIKLQYPNGHGESEVLARNHEEFFYDQGVPKEKPFNEETYNLVTETSDLALDANREDLEVRTTKTSYSGQNNLGWKLREPTSVTIEPRSKESNPNGLNLTTSTIYNETTGQITETRGAAAEHTLTFAKAVSEGGTEAGKLKDPDGITVDSSGNIWVADTANNRIEKFSSEGTYLSKFGEAGTEAGKLKEPEGITFHEGELWVADTGNNRIEEYNPTEGKFLKSIGSLGSEKGQLKAPSAITFDSSGNLWIADTGNNRIQKFNSEGKATSEFGSAGSEPGKLKEPAGITIDSEGHVWVADKGNNRLQEFNTSGTVLTHIGVEGSGEGQLKSPAGLAIDASGDVWAADALNGRVEGFSPSGAYSSQFGWKGSEHGQLNEPHALAVDAHGNIWVADSANNRLEEFSPGPNAHDEKTIYYGAETNESYPSCGKHPEWAGLVCKTLPAKQPELANLPKLPETTTTYNIWFEPETIEEAFGSTTRKKTEKYYESGRLKSSETTATGSSDKTLPSVSLAYSETTGAMNKQTTTVEGKEQTITTEENFLGQRTKYTDSTGNTATFKYAGPENDFLLEEVTDSRMEVKEGKEQKSYQRFSYEATTKAMNKLEDSAAGVFTASYDAELNMTSELFPNGMCANYTRNSVGETTSLEYIKTTNCAEKEPTVLYSDTRIASVHGAMLSQTSTLASENYGYDPAERLIEVQETPAGEGCTARAYTWDEESNRASLTTRKPGSKNECQTEGGTAEAHNYNEANRLTDAGIGYEAFGNIEKLPAADAEGHELTSTFYVDNAVATVSQNGVSHEYKLDPEGRVRETITAGAKLISHYDGPGAGVAWTSEEEGKKSTRDIVGIDGALTAVQTNNETPVLQLHDLQGDTVATIGDSTSETKLKTTYNSTEFGAPNNGKPPPKYAWLGANGIADELSSGVITFGTTSYVPQDARSLQAEQVAPPGLPDGSGAGAPVSFQEEPWVMQGAIREANEAPGLEAGREHEAEEAACRANPAACEADEAGGESEVGDEVTEFEAIGATVAMIPGPHSKPRGYFKVEFQINNATALILSHAFALAAAGDNPGTLAAIKGLPSALYTALLRWWQGKQTQDFATVAKNLKIAGEIANSPITILAEGYLYGFWEFHVIFSHPSDEPPDE